MGDRQLNSFCSAIIVDLDGTLLTRNSFKEYLKFAAWQSLRRLRIDIIPRVAAWIAVRKLRLITHSQLKQRLLRVTEPIMGHDELHKFANRLARYINPSVCRMCRQQRQAGKAVILATAAPASYASLIAQGVSLDGCIATPPSDTQDWRETVREEKRDQVLALLRRNKLSLHGIITDHHDDLPLMRVSENITLVSPDKKTLDAVNAEGLLYNIIITVR